MAWIDDSIFRYKGNDLLVMLYLVTHMDEKGICMVGIRTLATEIGISYQAVREALKRLQPQHITTQSTTHQGTAIEVLNFAEYTKQNKKQQRTSQRIQKATSLQTQKTLKERQHEFGMSLTPYLQENGGNYPKEMIRAFFNFWSEPNQAQTKMRFEMEKTWEAGRRLATWASRNNKFTNNGTDRQLTPTERTTIAAESAMAKLLATNKPVE